MENVLKNDNLTLTVSTHGAEAVSLKKGDVEYLWKGDPKFWGRHAPVLFPLVGTLKNNKYRHAGKEYQMGQHGFARDHEFTLVEQTEDTLLYALTDDEKTQENYPFHFELKIRYILKKDTVEVQWIVDNPDEEVMLHFSIGGHPAFMCPLDGIGDWSQYRITLSKNGQKLDKIFVSSLSNGTVGRTAKEMQLEDGTLTPSHDLFLNDALILNDAQADQTSLVDPDGKEYVTVKFSTPVLGIWSPVGKDAPFICIEPWYGRADGEDFDGELKDREYGNSLNPGETFVGSFEVIIR